MRLGINLSFAVKRLPGGNEWARFIREELDLDIVQFTFDLIDPWTPQSERETLASATRRAAETYGIEIHSAFTGLAAYTYNGLMHPEPAGRRVARTWWERAINLTAELGCRGIGGQLGALSYPDYNQPERQEALFKEAFEGWIMLSEIAKSRGLQTMYIEPTPLKREFPHTIEEATSMIERWQGETALPVKYALDVGHAMYQPLYGGDVQLDSWLDSLKEDIGLLHLQNTDGMSDSHWGWPHPDGTFDVQAFGEQVRQHDLDDKPIFIEVFYAFEQADDDVLENIKSTVAHCKSELGI
jgi:sugar phosphate isomerase/epimerase